VLNNNANFTVGAGHCNVQSVVLNDKIVISMCCSKVNDKIMDFKFWSKEIL